jgi:hypothetical protein
MLLRRIGDVKEERARLETKTQLQALGRIQNIGCMIH